MNNIDKSSYKDEDNKYYIPYERLPQEDSDIEIDSNDSTNREIQPLIRPHQSNNNRDDVQLDINNNPPTTRPITSQLLLPPYPQRYYDVVYSKETFALDLPPNLSHVTLEDHPLHQYDQVNFTYGHGYFRCLKLCPSLFDCCGLYSLRCDLTSTKSLSTQYIIAIASQIVLLLFLLYASHSLSLQDTYFYIPFIIILLFYLFSPIFIETAWAKTIYLTKYLPQIPASRDIALNRIKLQSTEMVKPIYFPQISIEVKSIDKHDQFVYTRHRIPILQFKRLTTTSPEQFCHLLQQHCQSGGQRKEDVGTSVYFDINIQLIPEQCDLIDQAIAFILKNPPKGEKLASIRPQAELVSDPTMLDAFSSEDKADYESILNSDAYHGVLSHWSNDQESLRVSSSRKFKTFWGEDFHPDNKGSGMRLLHPRTLLVPLPPPPPSQQTILHRVENAVYQSSQLIFLLLSVIFPIIYLATSWRVFSRTQRVVYHTTSFIAVALPLEQWCHRYLSNAAVLRPELMKSH